MELSKNQGNTLQVLLIRIKFESIASSFPFFIFFNSIRNSFLQQSLFGGEKEIIQKGFTCLIFLSLSTFVRAKTRREDILYFVYLSRFFFWGDSWQKGTEDTFVWITDDFVIGTRLHWI